MLPHVQLMLSLLVKRDKYNELFQYFSKAQSCLIGIFSLVPCNFDLRFDF